MLLERRGQHLGEYAVLIGIVASAFVGTQLYVSRRVAGSLIGSSQSILGTPEDLDGDGSSTSTTTSSVTESGNATAVVTSASGNTQGQSQAGFILAEAYGPYLADIVSLKHPPSRAQLLEQLQALYGEEKDYDLVSLTEEIEEDGNVVLHARVTVDGEQVNLVGLLRDVAITEQGTDDVMGLLVEGGPSIGRTYANLDALLQDQDFLSSFSEEDQRALFEAVGDGKEAIRRLTNFDMTESEYDLLSDVLGNGVPTKRWSRKDVEAAFAGLPTERRLEMLDLIDEQYTELNEAMAAIDDLITHDPRMLLVRGMLETLDDDDGNGLLDAVGYLNSANLWQSVLMLDDTNPADVSFILEPLANLEVDRALEEREAETFDELDEEVIRDAWVVLGNEINDEAIFSIVEGMVNDLRDPGRGYFRMSTTAEDVGAHVDAFMDQERYQEWGISSSDHQRVGKLRDVLESLSAPHGASDEPLETALGTLLPEHVVSTPERVYRTLDGEELFVMRGEIYKDSITTDLSFDLPAWREEAGQRLVVDDEQVPIGISLDGDDTVEIEFLSGSGRKTAFGLPEVHAVRRNVNGSPQAPMAVMIEEHGQGLAQRADGRNEFGEAVSGLVALEPGQSWPLVMGVSLDRDHTDAEAFLASIPSGEDGSERLFMFLDANGNRVFDEADRAERPVEFNASFRTLVQAPEPQPGQSGQVGISLADLRRWQAREQGPAAQGDYVRLDAPIDQDGLPDLVQTKDGTFKSVVWAVAQPTKPTDGITRMAAERDREYLAERAGLPEPNLKVLEGDGPTVEEAVAAGRHPDRMPLGDVWVRKNPESVPASATPLAGPGGFDQTTGVTQEQPLDFGVECHTSGTQVVCR